MSEEWKDIKGYEGLYQVSNLGNVRNKMGKLLKPFRKGKYGHAMIGLSKDNKSSKFQVHRLVAIHFVPNPENKPEVCHKDNTLNENGFLDNSAENLIWGTHKENCEFENTGKRQSENHANFEGINNPNYGNHLSCENKEKMMKERGKQVVQWENGRIIAFYESLKDAGRKTNISWMNIKNVCDGKYKHAGGYEWSYAYKYYDLDKVVEQIKSLAPANYVSKDDVLKIVKGDNFSHNSEKNSFFNFDEVIRIECEKARSKAIDDFVAEFKNKDSELRKSCNNWYEFADRIAEQLKKEVGE